MTSFYYYYYYDFYLQNTHTKSEMFEKYYVCYTNMRNVYKQVLSHIPPF